MSTEEESTTPRMPKVVIALQRLPNLPSDTRLLIIPSNSTGNDFGLRIHARFGINQGYGQFEWLDGYLAFKDEKSNLSYLRDRLSDTDTPFLTVENLSKPFFTQLLKIEHYRRFVETCGRTEAISLAKITQDLAHLHFIAQSPQRWSDFAQSPQFSLGLMRMSQSAFAYYNGGSVLAGRRLDALDARSDFSVRVGLRETDLVYEFTFRPGSLSDNRIAALIGPNGSGKTHSLIAISKALMDVRKASAILSPTPPFNQVLVFAHSRVLRRFRLHSRHPTYGAQRVFGLDPVISSTASRELTELFAQILRNLGEFGLRALDALQHLVQTELKGIYFQIPVHREAPVGTTGDYEDLSFYFRGFGEQERLELLRAIDLARPMRFVDGQGREAPLSLGQSVFLTFVLRALAYAGIASAFLIDEPENFLHPNLISRFVRVLHTILSETRSIAIVATHSPYVVRELSKTQVHVLQIDGESGRPNVERPRLQTFGANVAAVSDAVFDDDLPQHLYLERLRHSDYSGQPFDVIFEKLKDELSLDALMRLRAIVEGRDQTPAEES